MTVQSGIARSNALTTEAALPAARVRALAAARKVREAQEDLHLVRALAAARKVREAGDRGSYGAWCEGEKGHRRALRI